MTNQAMTWATCTSAVYYLHHWAPRFLSEFRFINSFRFLDWLFNLILF